MNDESDSPFETPEVLKGPLTARDSMRCYRMAHPATRSAERSSGLMGRTAHRRRSRLLKEHRYILLVLFCSLKSEEANLQFQRPLRTQAATQACIRGLSECVYVYELVHIIYILFTEIVL